MKKILVVLVAFVFLLIPQEVLAQRGCCSWHGGVAGCSAGGRTICSDGSLSPSCTCGGSYSYSAPVVRPLNPTTGNVTYDGSSANWCNYDVNITWDKGLLATGYSVGISKTAGANPGPLPDTSSTSYKFTNITPGTWYVNLKSISNGTSASNVVYWTVTLPATKPTFSVSLSNSRLVYDFTCLSKVEGPTFLTNALTNSKPSGGVAITPNQAQTFTVKGWDKTGKTYDKTITYTPSTPAPVVASSPKSTSNDDTWVAVILGGLAIGGLIWIGRRR